MNREQIKLKISLAGVLVAGFILPAPLKRRLSKRFRQTLRRRRLSTFVQDSVPKKCQIVDARPTAAEMTVVGGDGTVYKTRTEAEGAMESVKVCATE